MGGSGSKVTCDNKEMQRLFGNKPCDEEQVQIANDLYNYYHLADKRWVGEYGYSKSDGCGAGGKYYKDNPDYFKKKEALEQALLDKLTAFFSKWGTDAIADYREKFEEIEKKIIIDLKDYPTIPFFCKERNGKEKYVRLVITDEVGPRSVAHESYMFDIETKQKKIKEIVSQAILGEAPAEEKKSNGVQPNLKF